MSFSRFDKNCYNPIPSQQIFRLSTFPTWQIAKDIFSSKKERPLVCISILFIPLNYFYSLHCWSMTGKRLTVDWKSLILSVQFWGKTMLILHWNNNESDRDLIIAHPELYATPSLLTQNSILSRNRPKKNKNPVVPSPTQHVMDACISQPHFSFPTCVYGPRERWRS